MSHTPERLPVQAMLDPETHRQFKAAAAAQGLTIQTVLSMAVDSFLLDSRKPDPLGEALNSGDGVYRP